MKRLPFLAGGWVLLILRSFAAGEAEGQGWIVDASAGAAEYDALPEEVGSVNAIVGVQRDGPVWMSVAGGVPLDSTAIPWAAGAVGGKASRWLGSWELGVEASLFGFGYRVSELRSTGVGATLTGLPFVAFSRGPARVEARSGVTHYTWAFDDSSAARTLFDSSLRGAWAVNPSLGLVAEGRLVSAAEGVYPYASAGVQFNGQRGKAWLSAGRWMAENLDQGGWSIGGQVNLSPRVAAHASFAREADDPLYWNGPRTIWRIGMSRRLGSRNLALSALPPPDDLQATEGSVVLRVEADEVDVDTDGGALAVAGDFTSWKPVPMTFRDGVWELSVHLPPGVYHYAFQRPDGSWFLPESIRNRVDDGFGGVNGVLVVVQS